VQLGMTRRCHMALQVEFWRSGGRRLPLQDGGRHGSSRQVVQGSQAVKAGSDGRVGFAKELEIVVSPQRPGHGLPGSKHAGGFEHIADAGGTAKSRTHPIGESLQRLDPESRLELDRQDVGRRVDGAAADAIRREVNDAEADRVRARCARCKLAAMDVTVRVGIRRAVVLTDKQVIRAIRGAGRNAEGDHSQIALFIAFSKGKAAGRATKSRVAGNRSIIGKSGSERRERDHIAAEISCVQSIGATHLPEGKARLQRIKESAIAEIKFVPLVCAQGTAEDVSVGMGRTNSHPSLVMILKNLTRQGGLRCCVHPVQKYSRAARSAKD
jgi:hypothetical protein